MAITHLDIGDVWQPTWTFKVGTVNTDPSQIVAKKMDPAGIITTFTENTPATPSAPLVRTAAGVFRFDISIDQAGYWYAKLAGTGAVTASETHEAVADPDLFTLNGLLSTRALVGLGETKDWLNAQQVNTGEDLELVRIINDISARFHDESRREFKVNGSNPQTRTFFIGARGQRNPWYIDGQYMGEISAFNRMVAMGDLAASPTTVQIIDRDWTTVLETVSTANITLHRDWRDPVSGPIRRLEFRDTVTTLSPGMRVAVTGNFGFPAVPGSVRQAVLDAIVETRDRDVEHYSTDLAPATAGGAQNVIVLGRTPQAVSLPPRALAVARYYRDFEVG